MKLPQSVGQKKTKAVEQMLGAVGLDPAPMPTEEVARDFNALRSDMVLLYELKGALSACETELQSLKAQYEQLCPGKSLDIPDRLRGGTASVVASASALARSVCTKCTFAQNVLLHQMYFCTKRTFAPNVLLHQKYFSTTH